MHFFLILIPLALALFLPCLIRRSQLAGCERQPGQGIGSASNERRLCCSDGIGQSSTY